jgi:uncharacterized pyridoxal phosphate-containing UPF0001 family protein
MGLIRDNAAAILAGIPPSVTVLAAAKSRDASEIIEVIDAGITDIGENYFQESRTVIEAIGRKATWHFIGHIQKNKVKHIVPLFDMIQTVDTYDLAAMIDQHAARHGKTMPVLVEVNSGRRRTSTGPCPRWRRIW